MKRLYNYSCSEHGVFERYASVENRQFAQPCPVCFKNSVYTISAPLVKLPGWDTSWPSAASKWERYHEKEGRKIPEESRELYHNTP